MKDTGAWPIETAKGNGGARSKGINYPESLISLRSVKQRFNHPTHVCTIRLSAHLASMKVHLACLPEHFTRLPSHLARLTTHFTSLPVRLACLSAHLESLTIHLKRLREHLDCLTVHI